MDKPLKIWNSLLASVLILGILRGVWITRFRRDWLGIWAGLELNILCFIPLLLFKTHRHREAAVKYFLIQACGSFILLAGGINLISYRVAIYLFISGALLLKLGAAPLHFWYPLISEEIDWRRFFLLRTLQKTAPLLILSITCNIILSTVLALRVVIRGIVGAVGGVNEVFLRKLLAYSSINHLGWMLLAILRVSKLWLVYFSFYCVIVGMLVWHFLKFNIFHLNQMRQRKLSWKLKIIVVVYLLSLGGIPPLLGFVPKWLLVEQTILECNLICLIIIILRRVITLFYYTRLRITALFIDKTLKKTRSLKISESLLWLFTTFRGLGLVLRRWIVSRKIFI